MEWEKIGGPLKLNGIQATCFRSEGAGIEEHFELGIFFGTFEERGLVSSRLLQKRSCSNSMIVFFKEAKDEQLRKEYDDTLIHQVRDCTKPDKVIEIGDIEIRDVEENLKAILKQIPSVCFVSEAKWLIDLGGSPIPYFLGLLGYLRDMFPRPKLTIFNPTGYCVQADGGYAFTSGFDRNIWVPRMWGYPDPALPWTYVFLLGFEGARSHDVLYRCEPQYMKALIGAPGYQQDYEEEAISRNKTFFRECGLLSEDGVPNVLKADAANPVQTWAVLQDLVKKHRNKTNICFVPLGSKGHALGSGLCALANSIPAVLYHMPRTYVVRDVKRGKYLWKYDIDL